MLIGLDERTDGIEDGHTPKRFPSSNSRTLRDINFKLGMLIGLERTDGIEDEHQGVP